MADPMDNRSQEEKEADRAMFKSAQMIGNAIIDGIAAYRDGKNNPDGADPKQSPAAAEAEVDPDDKPPQSSPAAAYADVEYQEGGIGSATPRSDLGPEEMYTAEDARAWREEQDAREAAEERQAGPENETAQEQEHDWREPIFSEEEIRQEAQQAQAFEDQHGQRVDELGEHQSERYGEAEGRTPTQTGMAKGELNEIQGRDIRVYGYAAAAGQAIDLGHVDEAEYKDIAQTANTEYAEAFEGTEIEKEAHAEMEKAGLSTGKEAVAEEDENHGISHSSENDQEDEMSWEDNLNADLEAAAGDMDDMDMGDGMEAGAEAGESVEVATEAAEAEMVMTV